MCRYSVMQLQKFNGNTGHGAAVMLPSKRIWNIGMAISLSRYGIYCATGIIQLSHASVIL